MTRTTMDEPGPTGPAPTGPGDGAARPAGRRAVAVVGAGVLVVAGVALGATTFASASSTPTPTATGGTGTGESRAPGTPGDGRMRGPHGPLGRGLPMGDVLHGEGTVTKPGGGYQVVLVQRGTVTAVTDTSITLRSADGFTATYTVTKDTLVNAGADGITSVAKGHEAFVLALKGAEGSDTAGTARRVGDLTRMGALREQLGKGRHGKGLPGEGRGAPDAPSPAPSTTASTASFA